MLKRYMFGVAAVLWVASVGGALAACPTYTYPSFTNGSAANGPEVTSNFNTVMNCLNGYSLTTTAPTIQKFTSSSGTYTTPANVKWIEIKMVGGGGGGGGGGSTGAGTGGNGGNTTFGSSLLAANGGTGGARGKTTASAGGTAFLGTGPIGLALAGAAGSPSYQGASSTVGGLAGSSSPLGGAGAAGYGSASGAGGAAVTNSGSGGGGGGSVSSAVGSGGAAGGYVDAIIDAPSATFAYAVGAAGSAGAAGTSGGAGGAGGSGIIIVTEHYNY